MNLKTDKRGWGINIITLFILIFVTVVMVAITNTNDPLIQKQQLNATMYALNWSHYNTAFISRPDDGMISTYVINIVYKFVDTAGYCFMTIAQLGVQVGLKYPDSNWKLILWGLLFVLAAPLVYLGIQIVTLLFIIMLEIRDRKKYREEKRKWKR